MVVQNAAWGVRLHVLYGEKEKSAREGERNKKRMKWETRVYKVVDVFKLLVAMAMC